MFEPEALARVIVFSYQCLIESTHLQSRSAELRMAMYELMSESADLLEESRTLQAKIQALQDRRAAKN